MRRILPLIALAVMAAACSDISPTATPSGPAAAKGGHGGDPGPITIATALTASISGPTQVGNGQTCSYTGVASGGTAPYSYRWVPSYTGSGGSYFVGGAGPSDVFHGTGYYSGSSPSSQPATLFLEVTDAVGTKATYTHYLYIFNTAIGCI